MVRMVVTAEHQYAGRRLYPDQEYDCEQQHVELMKSRGWSRPVAAGQQQPLDVEQRSATYNTREMTARKRGK